MMMCDYKPYWIGIQPSDFQYDKNSPLKVRGQCILISGMHVVMTPIAAISFSIQLIKDVIFVAISALASLVTLGMVSNINSICFLSCCIAWNDVVSTIVYPIATITFLFGAIHPKIPQATIRVADKMIIK